MSKIEWTETTWNPVTGCTKISSGCKHCYAEVMSKRLKAMGQKKYKNNFKLTIHPDSLRIPLQWNKPRMIFVNSMSDLFHKDVPFEFIEKVFNTMREARQHTFQVLTKRSERLKALSEKLDWADNIWMGVSVEDQENVYRINDLKQTGAKIKFLSIEPLIGEINKIDLEGIHWVIVGGESGVKFREVKIEWVRYLRDQCISSNVPFFFKQWGGRNKKKSGRLLDGVTWNQYPNLSYLKMT